MSKQNLHKLALVTAILSAVSWVVFILGGMSKPTLSEISDPLKFFQTIQDTKSVWIMYGWGGIFGTLLSIPYIIAFYDAMKETAPAVLLSMVITMFGAALTTFGFFSPLTTVYFYLPPGLVASPESLPIFKAVAEIAVKWLNVIGMFAGLTGIVWLTPFLPFLEPISVILRLSNILLIFVWSIGLSTALVRQKEPAIQQQTKNS